MDLAAQPLAYSSGNADKLKVKEIMLKYYAVFICLIMLLGCSEKNEIKAPSADGSDGAVTSDMRPDQELRNARIFLYDGSVQTTDIKADRIEKYEKRDSTLAWNLDVHFFDSVGVEVSHLIADSGLVREQINLMEAMGHVVVTTEDSVSLKTEYLIWNSVENIVKTDSFVVLVQGGDTLRGYEFEADPDLGNWKIKRQVSGAIQRTDEIIK